MKRSFIYSIAIHIAIFAIFSFEYKKSKLNPSLVGEVVSVNMVNLSKGNSSRNIIKKSTVSKEVKDKKENKKIKKNISKKKEVIKPIKNNNPKKKQVQKVVQEKKIEKSFQNSQNKPVTKDIVEEKVKTIEKVGSGAINEKVGVLKGRESTDQNLVKLQDGSYAIKNQGVKGSKFGFISKPEPNYPALAKRMGIKKDYTVRVVMIFKEDGNLESYRFIDGRDKYGFSNEVEKAIKNWKLTEIIYNGKGYKMKYSKIFKFRRL